jgi:hypothetical protein
VLRVWLAEAMNADTASPPTSGGPFLWWAGCVWLPGCVAYGGLVAWAAYEMQAHFAPLVVFPVLIGLALGASLVALARVFQMGHRPTAWLAVTLAAMVVVVGQHCLGYRAALIDTARENAQVRQARATFGELVQGTLPPPPESFMDYLRGQAQAGRPLNTLLGRYAAKGAVAWFSWAVDAALVFLPAAVTMGFALRHPFCPRCRSWYTTRRRGRLDAASAQRVAGELGLPVDEASTKAWYRWISCNGGCAPDGFLLCWEGQRGSRPSEPIVWLDGERRRRIVGILDGSTQVKTHAHD